MRSYDSPGRDPRERREEFEADRSWEHPDHHRNTVRALVSSYKQLNAPFGAFGQLSLRVATAALASGNDSSDATYTAYESTIGSWTSRRDALAAQMKAMLAGATFSGASLDERQAQGLIVQGAALLAESALFAAHVPAP